MCQTTKLRPSRTSSLTPRSLASAWTLRSRSASLFPTCWTRIWVRVLTRLVDIRDRATSVVRDKAMEEVGTEEEVDTEEEESLDMEETVEEEEETAEEEVEEEQVDVLQEETQTAPSL
jgi:CBS domain containing-hemolysin-like protein